MFCIYFVNNYTYVKLKVFLSDLYNISKYVETWQSHNNINSITNITPVIIYNDLVLKQPLNKIFFMSKEVFEPSTPRIGIWHSIH